MQPKSISNRDNNRRIWRLMFVLISTLLLSCACHLRPPSARRIAQQNPVPKPVILPVTSTPSTTTTTTTSTTTTTTESSAVQKITNGIRSEVKDTEAICKVPTVDSHDVECNCQAKVLALKTELAKLEERAYDKLLIENCSIAKISPDLFPTDMKFASIIVLSAQDLSSFTVGGLTGEVIIEAPSKLGATFLAAFIKLNPDLLKLSTSLAPNIDYTLANLFTDQTKLEYLTLIPSNYRIGKIANTAFVSQNIRFITLTDIPILNIESGAFTFVENVDGRIHGANINMKNCSLNNVIFDELRFPDTARQQTLQMVLEQNSLTYMPEKVLNSYLKSHVQNSILVGSNPFNCDDIKNNLWLWKYEKASLQVHSAFCQDRREYFSIKPYLTRCQNVTEDQSDFECDCAVPEGQENPEFVLEQEFLYANQLSSIEYDNIQNIVIRNCVMTRINQELNRIQNLRSLSLYDTQELVRIDEKSFTSNVDKMKIFSLNGPNKMKIKELSLLAGNFANLEKLNLSVYPLTDCALTPITNKTNLQEYRLQSCRRILSIDDGSFDEMPNLSKLILDDNRLELAAPNESMFRMTPKVDNVLISLKNCHVTDELLASGLFNSLPKVNVTVNLTLNNITLLSEQNIGFILGNRALSLDLADNPLLCSGDGTGNDNVAADSTHALHWLYLKRDSARYQINNAKCAGSGRPLFAFIDDFFTGTDCAPDEGSTNDPVTSTTTEKATDNGAISGMYSSAVIVMSLAFSLLLLSRA